MNFLQPEREFDLKAEDLSLICVQVEEGLLQQYRTQFQARTFPMKTGMFLLVLKMLFPPPLKTILSIQTAYKSITVMFNLLLMCTWAHNNRERYKGVTNK